MEGTSNNFDLQYEIGLYLDAVQQGGIKYLNRPQMRSIFLEDVEILSRKGLSEQEAFMIVCARQVHKATSEYQTRSRNSNQQVYSQSKMIANGIIIILALISISSLSGVLGYLSIRILPLTGDMTPIYLRMVDFVMRMVVVSTFCFGVYFTLLRGQQVKMKYYWGILLFTILIVSHYIMLLLVRLPFPKGYVDQVNIILSNDLYVTGTTLSILMIVGFFLIKGEGAPAEVG